jgi:hypothetical protein
MADEKQPSTESPAAAGRPSRRALSPSRLAREDMVGVLMTQCRPGALRLPAVVLDFWTSAYQAIDD